MEEFSKKSRLYYLNFIAFATDAYLFYCKTLTVGRQSILRVQQSTSRSENQPHVDECATNERTRRQYPKRPRARGKDRNGEAKRRVQVAQDAPEEEGSNVKTHL